MTNTIHTSGIQFWRKIRGRATCTPHQTNTQIKLQIHDLVRRYKVHRNHTRLGLQTETSAYITTRIHRYIQLLPHDSTETPRIHTHTRQRHPRWDHKIIQIKRKTDAKGAVYIVANHGMYDVPQSGLLANRLLEKRLNKHGYRQSKLAPGLWKH